MNDFLVWKGKIGKRSFSWMIYEEYNKLNEKLIQIKYMVYLTSESLHLNLYTGEVRSIFSQSRIPKRFNAD